MTELDKKQAALPASAKTAAPATPVPAAELPPAPVPAPKGVARNPVAAKQSDAAAKAAGPPGFVADDTDAQAAAELKMFGEREGEAAKGGGHEKKFTKGDKKRRKELKGKLGYDDEFVEHPDGEGMEGGAGKGHKHNNARRHRERLEKFAAGQETVDLEAAQARVDEVQGDGKD